MNVSYRMLLWIVWFVFLLSFLWAVPAIANFFTAFVIDQIRLQSDQLPAFLYVFPQLLKHIVHNYEGNKSTENDEGDLPARQFKEIDWIQFYRHTVDLCRCLNKNNYALRVKHWVFVVRNKIYLGLQLALTSIQTFSIALSHFFFNIWADLLFIRQSFLNMHSDQVRDIKNLYQIFAQQKQASPNLKHFRLILIHRLFISHLDRKHIVLPDIFFLIQHKVTHIIHSQKLWNISILCRLVQYCKIPIIVRSHLNWRIFVVAANDPD